jgi:tetratricopeptide (TPR) repeat protein
MNNNANPTNIAERINLANLSFRSGELSQAESICKQILAEFPSCSDAFYLLGLTAFGQKQTEDGIIYLSKAIEINPQVSLYYYNFSLQLKNENRLEQALITGRQAANLEPGSVPILLNIGEIFQLLGQTKEAIEVYSKVIELSPSDVDLMYKLSLMLLEEGDLNQAKKLFLQLIKLLPDNVLPHYYLGLIHSLQGNLENAVVIWRKQVLRIAYQKIPNEYEPIIRYQLANALNMTGRYNEAVDHYFHSHCRNNRYSGYLIENDLLPYLNKPPLPSNSNKLACFSYPKCGTHLLADIIMSLTGTEAVFPATTTLTTEMLETVTGDGFLINHCPAALNITDYLKKHNYKLIINYRDPRDQLISFYFMTRNLEQYSNSELNILFEKFTLEQAINMLIMHTGQGSCACPDNFAWWMNSWLRIARDHQMPILFISYEQMTLNKEQTAKKIADFLGTEIQEQTIQQVVEDTDFQARSKIIQRNEDAGRKLKRKGRVGDWQNHFSNYNRKIFHQYAGRLIEQLGYEVDNEFL